MTWLPACITQPPGRLGPSPDSGTKIHFGLRGSHLTSVSLRFLNVKMGAFFVSNRSFQAKYLIGTWQLVSLNGFGEDGWDMGKGVSY